MVIIKSIALDILRTVTLSGHSTFLQFTEPDICTAEPVVREPAFDKVEIAVEKL
jgi:hypothetical protein